MNSDKQHLAHTSQNALNKRKSDYKVNQSKFIKIKD